jgi:hypothetical protein
VRVKSNAGSATHDKIIDVVTFSLFVSQGNSSTQTALRIANHPTVVRGNISGTLRSSGTSLLRGLLYVFKDGSQILGSPFEPNKPKRIGANTDTLDAETLRAEDGFFLRDLLNFYFGMRGGLATYDPLDVGAHTFVFAVSPNNPIAPPQALPGISKPDLKARDDFITVENLPEQNFVTTRPFRLLVIVDPRLPRARADALLNVHRRDFDYLASAYPIDGSKPNFVAKKARAAKALDIDALVPAPLEFSSWDANILGRLSVILASVNAKSAPDKQFDKAVLFLDRTDADAIVGPKANGVAFVNGSSCIVGTTNPATMSHELGHTLGLFDEYVTEIPAENPPNPRRPDADVNGNFVEQSVLRLSALFTNDAPYLAATMSIDRPDDTLPDVPYRAHTLLSAGLPNRWPDLHERKYLYTKLRAASGGAGAKNSSRTALPLGATVVSAQGFIDTSDHVTVTRVARGNPVPAQMAPGDFALELLDGSGSVLSTSAFRVNFYLADGGLQQNTLFDVAVPDAAGATTVQIRKGSNVLFSRPISPNAPNVQLLSPLGGEQVSGTLTISWSGSDPDGDELTYSLFYLADDGSAVLLADGLSGTTFQWDDPSLDGGSVNGGIVVTASDGVNETSATSASLSVAKNAPSLTILEPADTTAFLTGTPVTMSGAAYDPEEGFLPEADLSFRSSIDGELGAGSSLSPTLSNGRHTLTFRAVDSDGMAAETSITVTVGSAEAVPFLDSVSPSSAKAGTAVALNGKNFAAGATVRFGGVTASVLSLSSTQIVAAVPAGLPLGETTVSVASGGLTTQRLSFNVVYGRPLVDSVTPASGPPGTLVCISGAEFDLTPAGNTVRFGNAAATVLGAGLDGLLVTVPAELNPGGINVTVTTAQGTSDPVPFTVTNGQPATRVVLSSIAPSTAGVGSLVTVNGSGLSTTLSGNLVRFNDVVTTPVSATSNSLQVFVPFGIVPGNVNVIVSVDGYPSNPLPFTVSSTSATPTPTPGAPGCVTPPPNMVSWWPANGNANDIQGTNNGTLQGGATATAAGKVGQAFSFNGSTGYVALGNPATLKISGALSIDAWINPSAGPAPGQLTTVVTKWAQDRSLSATSDSYGLWIINSSGTLKLFSALHKATGVEPTLEGGVIPLNTWSHVAMTFDPSNEQYLLYVNGAQVAAATSAGNNLATDRNISIGREESFIPRYFSGLIDEVEIFTRALSAAEIQGIYNAGAAGKCNGTNPSPTPAAVREVQNISTRVVVGTGENVAIGGFIVTGSGAKRVIVRAIGPSLANFGVAGALQDPTLELFDGAGSMIAFNDDWSASGQNQEIAALLPPANGVEAAIIAALTPGNYTALLRGYENGTGIALVEVYDLDQGAPSRLANISTRGQVSTGGSVLIGGFIVGKQSQFVVRAIGPSLGAAGIGNVLANPVLELYNGQGTKFDTNDNWQEDSASGQVSGLGLAPNNALESALIRTLSPGNYTAIVRGVNDGVGVGLVEVYSLQ